MTIEGQFYFTIYRSITAINIDPLAIEAAGRNIKLNNLTNVRTIYGSICDVDGVFFMIVASLLLNTLIEMEEDLLTRLADGGISILSDILIEQEDALLRSYKSDNLELVEIYHNNKLEKSVDRSYTKIIAA